MLPFLLAVALAVTPADAKALLAEADALAWEAERRGLIAPDFGAWQRRARPEFDWDAPHFDLMHERLDRVTSGDLKRLLLEVAIRHGKTETLTGYQGYRLELEPSTRILLGTYSQNQARKLSRTVRRLAKARGVEISADANSVDEWETTEGGGMRAVGAGAGVASVNADLIIIDDPIGSRAEAESAAHRDRVWDWITTDILARAEPHTQVVFSMPRWHRDDPSGRMQDRQAGRWDLVSLPGVAEDDDMLGRAPGELLWASHRPQSWVDAMRIDLGSYGFASAVQCRPSPREGGMFKWDWWKLVDDVPQGLPVVRYWDTAGTDATGSNDPDYTAGSLGCRLVDQRTMIVDVQRFRLSVGKRDAKIAEIAKADREKYGHRVTWWLEEESGIAGKERTAAIVRAVQALGITCHTERATGSKTLRAEPLASAAEAGNVLLGPGDWRDPFRLEAADFPGSTHDDQVDAAAGMFNKLGDIAPSIDTMEFRL